MLKLAWERIHSYGLFRSIILCCSIPLTFFANFVSASWEPDFHHDGYMFYPIWRMSLGEIPHRDYWEFKGFLYSFVANLVIPGGEVTLHKVRLFNSLLTIVCALLIFLIFKNLIGAWLSVILALLWVATNPAWTFLPSDFPNAPLIDPNYLSLLLILMGSWLYMNSTKTTAFPKVQLTFAGLCFGLLPWVQQKALIFITSLIVITILFSLKYRLQSRNLPYFIGTCSLFTLLPVSWIWSQGALSSWFTQIFKDLFLLSELKSPQVYISPILIVTRIAVFLIMSLCFLVLYTFLRDRPSGKRFNWFKVVAVIVIVLSPIFAMNQEIDSAKDLSFRNWTILIASWLPNSIWYFSYTCCAFSIFAVLVRLFIGRSILRSIPYSESNANCVGIKPFIFSLGVTSLFYIYPSFGYFWWFAPTALLTFLLFLKEDESNFSSSKKSYSFLKLQSSSALLSLLISSLLLFLVGQSMETFEYRNSKLKGMVEFQRSVLVDKEKELDFIRGKKDISSFTLENCLHVLLLVEFNKQVKTNVYYGPLPIRSAKKSFRRFNDVFTCTYSSVNLTNTYLNAGYLMIDNVYLSDGRELIHWRKKRF